MEKNNFTFGNLEGTVQFSELFDCTFRISEGKVQN